jgi:hypothetical protein
LRENLSKLRIGRRDLRMISGIVMLCYLASHLANHALGLVSLDAAELRGAVQFWRNLLVTVALYAAAGVHVALAIVSVYERRTFRLPALELLRIALGLWLPVMLIGHAVTTRLEYELVGVPSTYTRVVSDLWARDGEWQHMGLLAPGWLHGCLGLNFAFGRRPFWRRYRFVLLGANLTACAIPTLPMPLKRGFSSRPQRRSLQKQSRRLRHGAPASYGDIWGSLVSPSRGVRRGKSSRTGNAI